MWHIQSNQKTFIPRFKGSITGLKSIPDYLLVSLSTNQVVILRMSDQEA